MNYIINLNEVSLKDINLVGGKNASLGEMIQNIESMGIKVPNGFAVTTNAYRDFIDFNGFQEQVVNLVSGLDDGNLPELRRVGAEVRQLIRNGIFPPKIKEEIRERYMQLSESYGQKMIDVAVRSSATAEDLPDASFAGQQETFLNVRGSESIL
jgi:pyruvate,water dikinase